MFILNVQVFNPAFLYNYSCNIFKPSATPAWMVWDAKMRLHLWHSDTKTHLSAKTKGNNLKMNDKKARNKKEFTVFFLCQTSLQGNIFWKVTKALVSFFLPLLFFHLFEIIENLSNLSYYTALNAFVYIFSKKANKIGIYQTFTS